jgi:hypothetical protein
MEEARQCRHEAAARATSTSRRVPLRVRVVHVRVLDKDPRLLLGTKVLSPLSLSVDRTPVLLFQVRLDAPYSALGGTKPFRTILATKLVQNV